MKKKTLYEDALILSIVKAARFLVRRLPMDSSLWAARKIGAVTFYFSKRRFIAHKNLRAAFGEEKSRAEIQGIARRSVENLCMSAVEILRFPELDMDYVGQNIRILGTGKFEADLKDGRGLIFLTGHFGAWELLNVTAGMLGYPMVALARVQKHPRSDEYLNSLRTSKGGQVIRKGMPIREILRSLKKGKIVGMLSDQDGGRGGVFVRFFGRMSSSPPGVATFALRTDAPIYPVFNFREGWQAKPGQKPDWKKHRIEVEGPLEMPAAGMDPKRAEEDILQQFSKMLEEKIRTSPEQWLWAHRRWKSTPDRFVVVLSDGKAGHLNQSLAVYEAYRKERTAQGFAPERTHLKVMEIRFKSVLRQKISQALCVLFRGHVPFSAFCLSSLLEPNSWKGVERSYADVVISCGTSLASLNLFMKRENKAKSILVMRPPCPSDRFDAVIVPRHDKMRSGSNIFFTRGALFASDEASLRARGQGLLRELSLNGAQPKIGFLIGGGAREPQFSREVFGAVLSEIARIGREEGAKILATTSRRTPEWAETQVKSELGDQPFCPLLVVANEANRPGIVPAILGASDVVVVSAESVSMVSEAVASGKPVVVFNPGRQPHLKSKFTIFLNSLYEEKLAVEASAGNIRQVLKSLLGGHGARIITQDSEALEKAVRAII